MRTAKTCGPDVPMLASTVATVHGSPGRARYKPESHCAGNVVCSPLPCMLMRALSVHIAHEIAGAARIRHSLRPLNSRARNYFQTSGAVRRENAKVPPRGAPVLQTGMSVIGLHLPHPLAAVLAGEQSDQRLRRVLQTIDDVFLDFQFAGGDQ